jgi:hypothetical protein
VREKIRAARESESAESLAALLALSLAGSMFVLPRRAKRGSREAGHAKVRQRDKYGAGSEIRDGTRLHPASPAAKCATRASVGGR